MIILFETYAGLCNQMFDIISGVYFTREFDFQYSFRSASFRQPNLVRFYNVPFFRIFSEEPFLKEKNYIPYSSIREEINRQNTFNFDGKRTIQLWNSKNFLNEIQKLSKKYKFIIIKQFWPLGLVSFKNTDILNWIKPSPSLLETYYKIRKELNIPDKYIFLHYRYERDFIKFFQVKIPNLNKIIKEINSDNKPIYIASTNINQLLDKKEDYIYYKNEEKLKTLNFEEKAMIDFLFGLDSYEIQGHKKSSFSNVLNNIKGTNNYYS